MALQPQAHTVRTVLQPQPHTVRTALQPQPHTVRMVLQPQPHTMRIVLQPQPHTVRMALLSHAARTAPQPQFTTLGWRSPRLGCHDQHRNVTGFMAGTDNRLQLLSHSARARRACPARVLSCRLLTENVTYSVTQGTFHTLKSQRTTGFSHS